MKSSKGTNTLCDVWAPRVSVLTAGSLGQTGWRGPRTGREGDRTSCTRGKTTTGGDRKTKEVVRDFCRGRGSREAGVVVEGVERPVGDLNWDGRDEEVRETKRRLEGEW